MGKAGRRKIAHEFDEQIVIKRYLSAFDEIARQRQLELAPRAKVAVSPH